MSQPQPLPKLLAMLLFECCQIFMSSKIAKDRILLILSEHQRLSTLELSALTKVSIGNLYPVLQSLEAEQKIKLERVDTESRCYLYVNYIENCNQPKAQN